MQQPSEAMLEEVREGWKKHSQRLFARDGAAEGINFGGHDIKNNPRLQETLHEIAEGYIPLCARKCELYDKLSAEGQSVETSIELRKMDTLINKHTVAMWKKLLGEGSGLQEEVQRQASEQEPADQTARIIAKELIGSVASALASACSKHPHPDPDLKLLGLIPPSPLENIER